MSLFGGRGGGTIRTICVASVWRRCSVLACSLSLLLSPSLFLVQNTDCGIFLDDDAQWFQQRSSHDADDGVPVPYLTEVPSAVLIGPFGVGGVVQGIDEPGWNVLRSEGAVSEGV